jgi:hypothetical protein
VEENTDIWDRKLEWQKMLGSPVVLPVLLEQESRFIII